uniref:LAM_G_DOMAIN domain-containing protein n=1 Tax=Ascaris lumbricoides TaxID=6252 RepID=A0A0M3I3J6_ASCLU
MIVSISQLEKRGKMKHTDIETFLTIHRKSLAKEDYVIVYRSPKIMEVTSTSLHKFPEIIITREKLLGGANDRQIRFTLHSAANGDAIGEAEIFYSQLITDGKINLKLHSRDLNGNTLFGVSKRTLHHVGVLHVNAFLDSCTMSSSSRGSSSSTVSTTSTQESRVRSLKDDEEPKEKSNVMMASGYGSQKNQPQAIGWKGRERSRPRSIDHDTGGDRDYFAFAHSVLLIIGPRLL